MAFSLYAATIPSFQQILGAVSGLLEKAETFCAEKDIAPQELIQARLAPDMFPVAYQVKAAAVQKPQPEVHIRADKDVRYEFVGRVVVTCQRAGIGKVALITEPERGTTATP